jgi:hypothetical protein
MLATMTDTRTAYAVEVSGWDSNKTFFVEKTELRWSERESALVCRIHVGDLQLNVIRPFDAMLESKRVNPRR